MTTASDPMNVRSRSAVPAANATAARSVRAWWPWAAVLAIGLLAQWHGYLRRESLWEDEIIAITHANEALPRFFIEVLRNDIHPPLYFLQLAAWTQIGTNTDAWVLANSVFWAAVSLLTMFWVARRLHGARAAWIATALLSVLPAFVWSASTLRMYAAVPACVLMVYYANRRWFETREARFLVFAMIFALITAYVHAIEFFFVAFIVGGALLEALVSGGIASGRDVPDAGSRSLRGSMTLWALVQVATGVCLLPLAASALLRGSDASAPSSAAALLTVGGSLIAGWKGSALPWARAIGTLIFGLLLVAALWRRESRWRTLGIPVAALVVATVVGLTIKPIFKQPVFAANLMPFIVLGAAAAAAQSRRIAMFLVAPCLVLLAVAAVPMVEIQAQSEGYAPAAHAIRNAAAPGDLVVVPNVSVYWGMTRYAIGPEWGSPLAIMPPPSAEWSRLNARIAQTFGERVPRRLGLVPSGQTVLADGVRYLIGDGALVESRSAQHVWLVTRERYESRVELDPGLVPSDVQLPQVFGDGELTVRRFDRPPSVAPMSIERAVQ